MSVDPLPQGVRIRNVSGTDTCAWCLNHALVCVATRPSRDPDSPYEAYGPCPYCEAGFMVEFPEGKPGPWGSDGYWRGREASEAAGIVKQGGGKPLSVLSNRERLEELVEQIEAARLERERAAEQRRVERERERQAALADLEAEHAAKPTGLFG